MLSIVDYGSGNLRSVTNAFRLIGEEVTVTSDPAVFRAARGIVLPGVGAFGEGMANLRASGIVDALTEEVLTRRKPFLGICLGLQFLGDISLENGRHEGLGWLRGVVRPIEPDDPGLKVPHMGWNEIRLERRGVLFEGLDDPPVFYFVHSYHLDVNAADRESVTSTCWHGMSLVASVEQGHVFAVQFHPEKSQQAGMQVLKNFSTFVAKC